MPGTGMMVVGFSLSGMGPPIFLAVTPSHHDFPGPRMMLPQVPDPRCLHWLLFLLQPVLPTSDVSSPLKYLRSMSPLRDMQLQLRGPGTTMLSLTAVKSPLGFIIGLKDAVQPPQCPSAGKNFYLKGTPDHSTPPLPRGLFPVAF